MRARLGRWWHVHAPGVVALVVERIGWCFKDPHLFAALGQLRVLANAWPTSRRMQSDCKPCLHVCGAARGDDIDYYMRCPLLLRLVKGARHQKPVWNLSGIVAVGLGVFPTTRAQTLCCSVWAYVAYRVYCSCRADVSVPSARRFWRLARAVRRSVLTRAPQLREHMLRAPFARWRRRRRRHRR